MSGFEYQPPSVISSTYNPSWFESNNQSITLADAVAMFYPIYGGTLLGSMTVQGNVIGSGASTISGFATISQSSTYTNTSTTDSSSTITGSMVISGGVGIAKSLFVGTSMNSKKCILSDSASNLLSITQTNSGNLANILYTNDTGRQFELGLRGSGAGPNAAAFYLYDNANSAFRMACLTDQSILLNTNCSITSAGNLSLLNTTDASSSTAGGTFNTAGGLAVAKKMYVGSNCFLGTGSAGGVCIGTSTDTARMLSCLNSNLGIASSNYITLGAASSNNNQAELSFNYAGAGSTSNKFEIGFYGSQRFLSIAGTGVVSITNTSTASTSNTTGALLLNGGIGLSNTTDASSSTNGGTLTTAGGAAIAKTLYVGTSANITSAMNSATSTIGGTSNTGGTLSITSVGYHIAAYYNSTNLTLLNTGSSGNFIISPQTGATSTTYTFTPDGSMQLSGLTPRNSHKMDLGTNTSKDNLLCLAQSNNTSPSYMLGVNNSTLQYVSGSAHAWYANASSTPAINGTQNMALTQQGSLILNNSGYHAYGSDITSLSSINAQGLHLQVASNVGTILNYNYSASTYGDLNLNSVLFVKASNSSVGIGTNNPGCPLEISGTNTQSTSSAFTFITSSATGQATGFSNRAFSLKTSGGIMVASAEIDCLSDLRTKQDVIDLDSDTSERFVRNITPIEYSYKTTPEKRCYGYGAQHLVREGLNIMVGATDSDEPLPEEVIECTDGSVILIGSDSRLVVDVLSCVPMLHSALKRALERIDTMQIQIDSLSKPAQA